MRVKKIINSQFHEFTSLQLRSVEMHQKTQMTSSLPSVDYFDVFGHCGRTLQIHSLHTLGIYSPIRITKVLDGHGFAVACRLRRLVNNNSIVQPLQTKIDPLKFEVYHLELVDSEHMPFENGVWYRILYRNVDVNDPVGVNLQDLYGPLFNRSVRKELCSVMEGDGVIVGDIVVQQHDRQGGMMVDETIPVLTTVVSGIKITDNGKATTTSTTDIYESSLLENNIQIIMK